MMVAIPKPEWMVWRKWSAVELAALLRELVLRVRLRAYRKQPWGSEEAASGATMLSALSARVHGQTACGVKTRVPPQSERLSTLKGVARRTCHLGKPAKS
jgi:hypothetical protein